MKTRTVVFVGCLCLAVALGFVLFRSPSVSSQAPLPQPNGYDSFFKAGGMLTTDPPRLDDLSTEELKSLVAHDAAALAVARVGLQQPCRVPLGLSISYATNHIADLNKTKRLARAFLAEGKCAERENLPADAAGSYLDAMRFGHECSRGGVIIDMLVGVACQSLGSQALQGLVDKLKAADCRNAIQQLEDMDSKAESPKEVAGQERAWCQRTFGWRGRLSMLVTRRSLQQNEQKTLAKLQAQQRAARLLMVQFAERAHELEHGVSPKSMSDLVPAYLKALPRDPAEPTKTMELPSGPAGKEGGMRQSGPRFQKA
jgi:hypothetical protein